MRSKLIKFEHLCLIPTVQGPDPCVHVAFTLNATVLGHRLMVNTVLNLQMHFNLINKHHLLR